MVFTAWDAKGKFVPQKTTPLAFLFEVFVMETTLTPGTKSTLKVSPMVTEPAVEAASLTDVCCK